MVVIIGNNITALSLSRFLELNGVDHRRISTGNIKDITFYCCDSEDGMMALAAEKLGYSVEQKPGHGFSVRTSLHRYKADRGADEFIRSLADISGAGHEAAEAFSDTLSSIGAEWKLSVHSGFKVNTSPASVMARNFMKDYSGYTEKLSDSDEWRKVLGAFVPKKDISLNTAAGYISGQVFDGSCHTGSLEHMAAWLINNTDPGKVIYVDSFDDITIDESSRTIDTGKGEKLNYDIIVEASDTSKRSVRLMTMYVADKELDTDFEFIVPDKADELGIIQMIRWSSGGFQRVDVYYDEKADENEISACVSEMFSEAKVTEVVGYDELIKQYGCGDFAGWAFSCRDNMKNPVSCMKKDRIKIAGWGNAHFTAALLGIKELEKSGVMERM